MIQSLAERVRRRPVEWGVAEVGAWLEVMGKQHLVQQFTQSQVDGSCILDLDERDLQGELGVTDPADRQLILEWVRHGFAKFELILFEKSQSGARDQPMQIEQPMQVWPWLHQEDEQQLFLVPARSAKNYSSFCLGQSGGVVGRQTAKCAVLLSQESISRQHASVKFVDDCFILEDLGSTCGTFLLVSGRTELSEGDLIEMGNRQYEVKQLAVKHRTGTLQLEVRQLGQDGAQLVTLSLGEKAVGFGRSANNQFPADDKLLSRYHARFSLIQNHFYIEDLAAAHSTWLRIKSPSQLLSGMTVRFGSSAAFECFLQRRNQPVKKKRVSPELTCTICFASERDALLEPCHHNSCCLGCVNPQNCCPICREPIKGLVRIYRS